MDVSVERLLVLEGGEHVDEGGELVLAADEELGSVEEAPVEAAELADAEIDE